jgi:hypothetical protein
MNKRFFVEACLILITGAILLIVLGMSVLPSKMDSELIMDASRIQSITPAGLTYIDDDGKEQFIDFAACYGRYWADFMEPKHLQRLKEINNWTDEKLHSWLENNKDWKEVARRDITGNPPFIEFYTSPGTRFEFPDEDALRWIRFEIEKLGWMTFDLS